MLPAAVLASAQASCTSQKALKRVCSQKKSTSCPREAEHRDDGWGACRSCCAGAMNACTAMLNNQPRDRSYAGVMSVDLGKEECPAPPARPLQPSRRCRCRWAFAAGLHLANAAAQHAGPGSTQNFSKRKDGIEREPLRRFYGWRPALLGQLARRSYALLESSTAFARALIGRHILRPVPNPCTPRAASFAEQL